MKAVTISVHLTILATIAYNCGSNPAAHPVACVFAGFSFLVLMRVLFVK